LGLGGNPDSSSPMYELLAAGIVRRTPAAADLKIPEAPDGADPERADLSLPAAESISQPEKIAAHPALPAAGISSTGPVGATIFQIVALGEEIASVGKSDAAPARGS